jgi:hypothetical protein
MRLKGYFVLFSQSFFSFSMQLGGMIDLGPRHGRPTVRCQWSWEWSSA